MHEASGASAPSPMTWRATHSRTFPLRRGLNGCIIAFETLLPRLGFALCLMNVMRCKVGSLAFMGLPCSAHVFMSSGTTLKTRSNPRGDMTTSCARLGNLLACRTAILILVCIARRVWWGAEQPATSVAPYLHYMDWAININRCMTGFPAGHLHKLRLGSASTAYDYMCVTLHMSARVRSELDGSLWRAIIEEINGVWQYASRPQETNHDCHDARPWQHMAMVASKLRKGDREKHKWDSKGVVKKTIVKAKGGGQRTSVPFGGILNCNVRPFALRSGGPRLKGTQAYPRGFCRHVASNHVAWCIDTCWHLWNGLETHRTTSLHCDLKSAKDVSHVPDVPDMTHMHHGPLTVATWHKGVCFTLTML